MRYLRTWLTRAAAAVRSRELWNIVLGVLIALAIGELAEAARWKWRVGTSERAMQAELSDARVNFSERIAVQGCLERRWRDVDAILRNARQSGELPAISEIGRSNHRSVSSGAWQSAVGEGVLLHMRPQQREQYSNTYERVIIWHGNLRAELEGWGKLSALVHAEGPISSDLLADLTSTLYTLRSAIVLNGQMAEQLDARSTDLGVAFPAAFDDPSAARAEVLERPICRPLIIDGKPFTAPDRPELEWH